MIFERFSPHRFVFVAIRTRLALHFYFCPPCNFLHSFPSETYCAIIILSHKICREWRFFFSFIRFSCVNRKTFFFFLGRKPRAAQKAAMAASPKKVPPSLTLFVSDDDQSFNSPKRKETKIDGVLMENGAGKAKEGGGRTKPFRPATRSTRKINEYFARLPANGIIRVQNGHGSHSEDSCDSFEEPENDPPAEVTQSKQPKIANGGPMLLPEAAVANANLFLQEPVLTLQFDKSEAVTNGATIKTSFLTSEITGKFQTLPPTEYINKVLNVNGSHDDDGATSDPPAFLLNSDSNSSDSGVVIGDEFMKSPLQMASAARRRKPTTPHRMILCSSPVKESSLAAPRTDVEMIKASRAKNRAREK